jgi:hypothetical protein
VNVKKSKREDSSNNIAKTHTSFTLFHSLSIMCEAKIDQKSHGANWKETVLEAPEGGGDGEDPFNTDLVGRGDEGGEGEDF